MRNCEIINNLEVLKTFDEYKLPVSIMWKISKNRKALEDIYKIYNEQRIQIIKAYANQTEDGNIMEENGIPIFTDESTRQKCLKAVDELFLQDNEEITLSKIKLDDLLSCDNDRYDPLDIVHINALSFMIEE